MSISTTTAGVKDTSACLDKAFALWRKRRWSTNRRRGKASRRLERSPRRSPHSIPNAKTLSLPHLRTSAHWSWLTRLSRLSCCIALPCCACRMNCCNDARTLPSCAAASRTPWTSADSQGRSKNGPRNASPRRRQNRESFIRRSTQVQAPGNRRRMDGRNRRCSASDFSCSKSSTRSAIHSSSWPGRIEPAEARRRRAELSDSLRAGHGKRQHNIVWRACNFPARFRHCVSKNLIV